MVSEAGTSSVTNPAIAVPPPTPVTTKETSAGETLLAAHACGSA